MVEIQRKATVKTNVNEIEESCTGNESIRARCRCSQTAHRIRVFPIKALEAPSVKLTDKSNDRVATQRRHNSTDPLAAPAILGPELIAKLTTPGSTTTKG